MDHFLESLNFDDLSKNGRGPTFQLNAHLQLFSFFLMSSSHSPTNFHYLKMTFLRSFSLSSQVSLLSTAFLSFSSFCYKEVRNHQFIDLLTLSLLCLISLAILCYLWPFPLNDTTHTHSNWTFTNLPSQNF